MHFEDYKHVKYSRVAQVLTCGQVGSGDAVY